MGSIFLGLVLRQCSATPEQCYRFSETVIFDDIDNIKWSNGLFFAISNDTTDSSYTSVDGLTWVVNTGAFASASVDVIATNGSRLLVADHSFPRFYTSDDFGASWTLRHTPSNFSFVQVFNHGYSFDAASNGNSFVVVGQAFTPDNNVYSSPDGITWTGQRVGGASFGTFFGSAASLNGNYYISGLQSSVIQLYRSTNDGVSWTALTPPYGTTDNSTTPMVWAGKSGELVMTTRNLTPTPGLPEETPERLWSTTNDGSSWTEHTLPAGVTDVYNYACDGVRHYIITFDNVSGTSFRFWYSTDLDTWIELPSLAPVIGFQLAASREQTNFVVDVGHSTSGAEIQTLLTGDLDCIDELDYEDTFVRADSNTTMGTTPPYPWHPQAGTWGIVSNQAYLVSATSQATAVIETLLADLEIEVTMPITGDAGLCFRSVDHQNHFVLSTDAGAFSGLYVKVGGGFTGLAVSGAYAQPDGTTIKVVLNGTSIKVYADGVEYINVTNSNHLTATKHGLRSNADTAARFTNFSVLAL